MWRRDCTLHRHILCARQIPCAGPSSPPILQMMKLSLRSGQYISPMINLRFKLVPQFACYRHRKQFTLKSLPLAFLPTLEVIERPYMPSLWAIELVFFKGVSEETVLSIWMAWGSSYSAQLQPRGKSHTHWAWHPQGLLRGQGQLSSAPAGWQLPLLDPALRTSSDTGTPLLSVCTWGG